MAGLEFIAGPETFTYKVMMMFSAVGFHADPITLVFFFKRLKNELVVDYSLETNFHFVRAAGLSSHAKPVRCTCYQ